MSRDVLRKLGSVSVNVMLGDIKAKQGSGLKVDKVIVMTDRLIVGVQGPHPSITHPCQHQDRVGACQDFGD